MLRSSLEEARSETDSRPSENKTSESEVPIIEEDDEKSISRDGHEDDPGDGNDAIVKALLAEAAGVAETPIKEGAVQENEWQDQEQYEEPSKKLDNNYMAPTVNKVIYAEEKGGKFSDPAPPLYPNPPKREETRFYKRFSYDDEVNKRKAALKAEEIQIKEELRRAERAEKEARDANWDLRAFLFSQPETRKELDLSERGPSGKASSASCEAMGGEETK